MEMEIQANDCPCKCIICKKCLSQYWDMEVKSNELQLREFEVLKRCKNNLTAKNIDIGYSNLL